MPIVQDSLKAGDPQVVWYLLADPSLECSGSEYDFLEKLAVVYLVVWPIGMPLGYLALLLPRRRLVHER